LTVNWLRRDPLDLRFEQREGILVPQTPALWALHADVFLSVSARKPATLVDASLRWETSPRYAPLLLCKWSRAVIDGRFHYPGEALSFALGPEPRELTLTFDADLIRHPEGPPPAGSRLVLHLRLDDSQKETVRALWRVAIESWERPARLEWLPGG